MMLNLFSNHGILGLNARNLLYIKPFNPRKAVAFADDKLKTKAYLGSRGIPVAKIFARIENRRQLRNFDFSALPDECVLKPNEGYGGEGILVLTGRNKQGDFLDTRKQPVSISVLRAAVEDILDGRFSLSGRNDIAFFEKLLTPHECFTPFHPRGLPDIRIVVFNLVPVMAMLRVPTAQSDGKANVHLGGLGIGIDIAKGVTTYATQYNRRLRTLPHGLPPGGVALPLWDELLLVASRIQYITNIGYLAVDLTLDAEQGPVLLEVNARAGLMVQVANLAPLHTRLKRVEGVRVSSPEKGVRIAQELFGEKVRRGKHAEPERPVLGVYETLLVAGDGVHIDVPCLIAPDQERTVFTKELIDELERKGAAERTEQGGDLFLVKCTLGGKKFQTAVKAGHVDHPRIRVALGRRDLAGFLIDPMKVPEAVAVRTRVKDDVRAMDRLLAAADRTLATLKYVKPTNLAEERARAERDRRYQPVFQYRPLPDNIDALERRLLAFSPDESPLGVLLQKKCRELLLRISLLRARGDSRRFSEASQALFGVPSSVLRTGAQAILRDREACDIETGMFLSASDAVPHFRSALDRYGLHAWDVTVRTGVVADCSVGGKHVILRAGAAFSLKHIAALIAHEIETHVLTSENGSRQPFYLLRSGCANYLDTQEGLAIYQQNRVLSPHHEKCYGPARSVLAVAAAMEHSFTDTRRILEEELGYDSTKALQKAIDVKRGMRFTADPGGFTKGLVYMRGLKAIEQFVADEGDLRRLFVGKIAVEDVDLVEGILGMQPPVLLPQWLVQSIP